MSDREHQQAEEKAQPLAAHLLSGACAELCAGDAAHHQDQRQHRIDQMIGHRVHHGCRRHGHEGSSMEVPITVAVGTRSR